LKFEVKKQGNVCRCNRDRNYSNYYNFSKGISHFSIEILT